MWCIFNDYSINPVPRFPKMSFDHQDIVFALDYFGTASFAVSGALRVIDRKPDFIGMLILATATALGGAILRDAIIGRPVIAFRHEGYSIVIFLSVLITFYFPDKVLRSEKMFLFSDAIGIGIYAAITANVAQQNGLGFLPTILLATIGGGAGGVVRDIIIQKPTVILSNELVITPVVIGAASLVLVRYRGGGELAGLAAAFFIGCGIRIGAIIFDWRLPRILYVNPEEQYPENPINSEDESPVINLVDAEVNPIHDIDLEEPKRVLVALATYNERENLPKMLDTIFKTVPRADVLVVDDASLDGTGEMVEERMKAEPRLFCIHRAGKLGLGTAVLDAAKYAIEHQYDYFVNLDADLSHDPAAIPSLLEKMEPQNDVVIGSRYVSGGKIIGWPLRRRFASKAVNFLARLLLSLKTRDNSGSFRCYRVSKLAILDFSLVRSNGYSFFEEILYLLKRTGANFEEVPITFTDRRHGSSKVNRKEAIRSLKTLLILGWKNLFWK